LDFELYFNVEHVLNLVGVDFTQRLGSLVQPGLQASTDWTSKVLGLPKSQGVSPLPAEGAWDDQHEATNEKRNSGKAVFRLQDLEAADLFLSGREKSPSFRGWSALRM
jgi:hypothetical protein